MDALLPDYAVTIEIPVAWGEMDAFQHVNNVAYFRYFESARIAYFDAIAMMNVMETTGVGPILAETRCRYRIPLTFPDTVAVGARVSALAPKGFTMQYAVASRRHGKVAAEGDGRIVTIDYAGGGKAPLPDVVRHRILGLEGDRLNVQRTG
jgi:acyl-CoA thioester hydrolase